MKPCRKMAAFDHGVVTNDRTIADSAVEQDRVEADEYIVANLARSMNDRPVGDRRAGPDRDCGTRLRMDHDTVLNVRPVTDAVNRRGIRALTQF